MIRLRATLLAAALVLPVAAHAAADLSADAAATAARDDSSSRQAVPNELSASERSGWRDTFAAIRAGDWPGAAARLANAPEGPMRNAAYAEYYLAKGSPKVELDPLLRLVEAAPEMPKADQLAKLAQTRGAVSLPALPQAQPLIWQGSQPRRSRAQATKNDSAAPAVEKLVQPLIVADRPAEAEAVLLQYQDQLSPEARTEFQQRIGWSYYLIGADGEARRLSELARQGSGDWAVHGAWVSGLASWRAGDCRAAGDAFSTVAGRSSDVELVAAGHYWAARADTMCAKPQFVQGRLRSAARHKETFYGMLSASALGIKAQDFAELHDYRDAEWRPIARKANVRTAIALAEIGETALADQFIRHQARIGGAADHNALLHLAADLNLASTQFWLAHNAPRGASINAAARYPRPDWRPSKGWRVEQSLVFAHALQESNFRTEVVSPAGAVGLMQVRPGTAGDVARWRGDTFSREQLNDPTANLEYGQSYIEYLRDLSATGGLLPKVIAAYNAGPKPIGEWNGRQMDKGDPLLYIESIPYWETRGYVPIVLRNYWIYDEAGGRTSASRTALAQGLWPRFPGLPGATAVRINPRGQQSVQGTD
jgi:soluble lytic murein transglycosylase-like protein